MSKFLFASICIGMLVFTGCYRYPEDDNAIEDYDAVLTNYVPGFAFGENKTYYMPDSVTVLLDDAEDSADYEAFFANGSDQVILTQIRENMQRYGYVRTDSARAADVGITPTFSLIDYTGFVGSPGWWWGYPGWWGWYYGGWGYYPGWGYPAWGYPGWAYTYSYTKGSVFLDMVSASTREEVPVTFVWTAVMRGVVSNSVASNQQRLRSNIDQAFRQSPYLSE